MQIHETYRSDTRLATVNKSIPVWIRNLQGTGNIELNHVVNELHELDRNMHPSADRASLYQLLGRLCRRVQAIKHRHVEPYQSSLTEIETELSKLRM